MLNVLQNPTTSAASAPGRVSVVPESTVRCHAEYRVAYRRVGADIQTTGQPGFRAGGDHTAVGLGNA